jgi:hypothetical protein
MAHFKDYDEAAMIILRWILGKWAVKWWGTVVTGLCPVTGVIISGVES